MKNKIKIITSLLVLSSVLVLNQNCMVYQGIMLAQNSFAIQDHSNVRDNTLYTKRTKCAPERNGNKSCDQYFSKNMILSHPNSNLMTRKSTELRSNIGDFSALIPLENFEPLAGTSWEVANFWSVNPYIFYSDKVIDSYFTDGYYRVSRLKNLNINKTLAGRGLIGRAYSKIFNRDQLNPDSSAVRNTLESIKSLTSKSQTITFLPDRSASNVDSFGGVILSHSTYHESMSSRFKPAEVSEVLRSDRSEMQKKSFLKEILTRDEYGLQRGNCESLENKDRTYVFQEATPYCVWNVFSLSQSFKMLHRPDFSEGKDLKVKARIRMLGYEGYDLINEYLEKNDLINTVSTHINLRVLLKRERTNDNPEILDPNGKPPKVKTADTISLHIPIFKMSEACLFPEFADNGACRYLKDAPKIIKESKFSNKGRPDTAMGIMMYTMGRNDMEIVTTKHGSNLSLTQKMRRFINGDWTEFIVNGLPAQLEDQLAAAEQNCINKVNANARGWGQIHLANCLYQSRDLSEYEISSISIGNEVRGLHQLAFQVGEFQVGTE